MHLNASRAIGCCHLVVLPTGTLNIKWREHINRIWVGRGIKLLTGLVQQYGAQPPIFAGDATVRPM
jgi:hypothetical protein